MPPPLNLTSLSDSEQHRVLRAMFALSIVNGMLSNDRTVRALGLLGGGGEPTTVEHLTDRVWALAESLASTEPT